MRIFTVSSTIPMPDRYSGDLRFFSLLRSLRSAHDVQLCAFRLDDQRDQIGESELIRYRKMLEVAGIVDRSPNPLSALQSETYDCILFEFYTSALHLMKEVRLRQPAARVFIDSVDVHFHRLSSRARLSGRDEDRVEVKRVQQEELAIYRSADAVIAVSDEDRAVLLDNEPGLEVSVISNFHRMHPIPVEVPQHRNRLVFVGGFGHHPNVDAIRYFCGEVFPLVKKRLPDALLTIVGSFPPDDIRALQSETVNVAGFVPELEPILRESHISIAPLRYGGGIKGKIGEAMAIGLPVVTTTVGIEGFGLTPESEILVADAPAEFAQQIVRLAEDPALYRRIRDGGWHFIRDRLSEEVVSVRARTEFQRLSGVPVKRLPAHTRLRRVLRSALDRHLLWRLRA